MGDRVGVSFRRLSIIDLSYAGHQPMVSADASCVLVFNGEIYNYMELRAELRVLGRSFESDSDSEVLLAAYSEWGEACFSRFNGMWAVAIYDRVAKRVLLSRDRLGIKPLYYLESAREVLFASELKGLFVAGADPVVDEGALSSFLLAGRVAGASSTFFKGVRQVEPGTCISWVLSTGRLDSCTKRFWNIERVPAYRGSEADAIEELREILSSSVKLQTRADVAVGSCLSGGLDSSIIVALVSELLGASFDSGRGVLGHPATFSACYRGFVSDESRWVDLVAQHFRVTSHRVFPSAAGLAEDVRSLIWHQEEPVASTSIYAQWCVMRLAAQSGVRVLLDGQGADEMFGGYDRYRWASVAEDLRGLRLAGAWRNASFRSGGAIRSALRELLGIAVFGYGVDKRDWVRTRRSRLWRGWGGRVQESAGNSDLGFGGGAASAASLMRADLFEGNLPALLRYEDRNSMAFSVEARVPYLDHRLVEFALALPMGFKLRAGAQKWVLRQAFQATVPRQVIERRDKIGFSTPESDWLLRNPRLWDGWLEVKRLSDLGMVESSAARSLLDSGRQRGGAQGGLAWRVICAEVWLEEFVHRDWATLRRSFSEVGRSDTGECVWT